MSLTVWLCMAAVATFGAVLLVPSRGLASAGEVLHSEPATGGAEPSQSWSRDRERRRKARVNAGPATVDEVGSALTLLALTYRSGLPTWEVLSAVAEQSPPRVAADLRQVAAALQWGAGEHEAWQSIDDSWGPAARAITIAHRAGIAPGPLLTKAADDLRRADLERIEVAAARVGVQLVAPLGLVLLPAFCLTTVLPLVVSLGRQLLTPS